MSRPVRILRNIAIGLGALIVLVVIAALVIVRTDWFRHWVAQEIVQETEASTGGTATIGAFSFEWSHLRAVVTDFVIHGNEPAGAPPFVSAARLELDLRFFENGHIIGVSYLDIDKPHANIMVLPDGRTNVPSPKQKQPASNTSALQEVVNLAVGHFQLSNGLLTFNSAKQPIDLRGNNLRMQLWYNLLKKGYVGRLSLDPLYVLYGRNTPVNFNITVPLVLVGDRIDVDTAEISTPHSKIFLKASLADMNNPVTSAHLNGSIALADLKNAADLPIATGARNLPEYLNLDANATVSATLIQVTGLRLGVGNSNIEASGTLKNQSGSGSLQFRASLDTGELGRMAKVSARPAGMVNLNGNASLDAANNYRVTGNIAARDLSFQQGTQRIRNVSLYSAVALDPHTLDLRGLRLSAFGGELGGNASLEDFARYSFDGNLRNFDIRTLAAAFTTTKVPYDGIISGSLAAKGDLKAPGATGVEARTNLVISPGRHGIPMSGRLVANYNGAANLISVDHSYIALPHTRLNLSGSVGNRLDLQLTSHDLNDLLVAAGPVTQPPPIALNGGTATLTASIAGSLSAPRISGHVAVDRFSLEDRAFDELTADLSATKSGASVTNASLTRGPMELQLAAMVGLRDWSPKPYEPLTANLALRNGDLADVLAMAGQNPAGYSGALTAGAHISGTIGDPVGTAKLNVANGAIDGQPFDQIAAQVNLQDRLVTIPAAYIASGNARVTLSAEFQHPRDSFSTGRVHAHVASTQIDLAQLRGLQKQQPGTAGLLNLNADVTGNLAATSAPATRIQGTPTVAAGKSSEFLLTSLNADITARALRFNSENLGDLTATARTSGSTVSYNLASDFAGSNIHASGATQLVRGYPTNASASMANLPIQRVLAAARQTAIPARGNLSGTAQFNGTMTNPQGSVDLTLASANLYSEPVDRIHARLTYLAGSIDIPQLEVATPAGHLGLTARYDHPAGDFERGNLSFNVDSNRIDLAKIHNLQVFRPGLGGTLEINAKGAGAVAPKDPRILFSDLNANVAATGISAEKQNFGDFKLAARTTGGNLDFNIDSNFAGSSIHGNGAAQLHGNYPVNARLTFGNVAWSRLHPFLASATAEPDQFDAAVDGQITVNGPVTDVNQLRGTFELTRLQLNTLPGQAAPRKPIVIKNQGPIVAALDRGTVTIRSAHLTGPSTDINAGGTVELQTKALNLSLNANADLALLQNADQDFYSSGNIVLASSVRGTFSTPAINGRLELHNASVNYIDSPNGISHANALIVFNGNNAVIRNFTGQSGGGKITLAGFAAFSPTVRFGVRASASGVRVLIQQGVSVTVDTDLKLTGTLQNGLASGTVTVDRIAYNPQSDIGSLLSRSAPPVQTPTAPSPILQALHLDIRIRTSPALSVAASLAQNLQAEADLRLRGTAAQPGMVGRVTISEGKLVFFGNTYTVNTGTINFYNPLLIQPVLNINLETQTQGVDVVLTVTGPIDDMKLTYTSDPPLQFQEIVELLAAGTTPTSDPNVLANQPPPPQQGFAQMGESAIVSQAVANPVASQLKRVFGVTQLKIDPTFVSGSEVPQARLTLQQQITPNLTFTYVQDLNASNTEIIRVEWAFNERWSAIANRDENGIFSIDFIYKREFR